MMKRVPRKDISKTRRGFTLIESVAAIVVLSIAIPPIFWGLRSATLRNVDPILMSRARWLAAEKLEDVIADRHSTTRGYDYLVAGNYPDEDAVTDFAAYARTVSLSETAADLATAGDGYMTVVVEVTWADMTGVERTLSVSTVLTEYTTE